MKRLTQFSVVAAALVVSAQASGSELTFSNPELPSEPEVVDGSNAIVPTDVTIYDDTRFHDQLHWDVLTETYKGRSEIESVHKAFEGYSKENVRVAVLDGGFYDSPDIDWAGGVNLTAADEFQGIEVGDDFRQYDTDTCDNAHGQAVSSIIGATADNNFLLAGIANVALYGVRVLGCGGGGAQSELADGIRWAAAHPDHDGQGYPSLDEPVDVINASISAKDKGDCPQDLKDAISYANDRGVTVVVAAGNASVKASEKAPGNCPGVITVGAVDSSGSQAGFTNYGNAVDISAQGVSIVGSSGTDGNGYYRTSRWDGTSFSAPIVAGIIAYTRSLTGNDDPQKDRDLVNASGTGFASTDNSLGEGVLNAPLMAENAFGPEIDQEVTAKQVLADPARCNNALFTQHSPISVPVCELYELDHDGAIEIPDGYELMVFEGDADNPLAPEQDNKVEGASESTFVFNPSNPSGDHAIQVCRPDFSDCKGSLAPIDVVTTINCSDSQAVAQARRRAAMQ